MECYVCSETGARQVAVALCPKCSAGLCLTHVRETAAVLRNGSLYPDCHHTTWTVPRAATGHRAASRPRFRAAANAAAAHSAA